MRSALSYYHNQIKMLQVKKIVEKINDLNFHIRKLEKKNPAN